MFKAKVFEAKVFLQKTLVEVSVFETETSTFNLFKKPNFHHPRLMLLREIFMKILVTIRITSLVPRQTRLIHSKSPQPLH